MATENTHPKKSAPKRKRVEVDALEKEEIIRSLALSNCTRATARRVGRDPMIVHRIKQANLDQILSIRAELVRDQHYEFVSVIKVTQSRIRDMVDQMELPEDPAEYPAFLGSLGKLLETQVDKFALLLDRPTEVRSTEGVEPLASVDEEVEAEMDKDYLRQLLKEIEEEKDSDE
jgi:hypothetical protein